MDKLFNHEASLERLKGQLTSLKNQPSEESKKKKLNRELMQKNFQRAEKVKAIIVRYRVSPSLSISDFFRSV